MAQLLKIRDWNKHFENNRTRDLKRMEWVPVPTKQDGEGYNELVDHPNGAAHFGAWVAIVEIAAKCSPRGVLLRDGNLAHTPQSLARKSHLPAAVFAEAIPRLISIGWLDAEVYAGTDDTENPAGWCGEPAANLRDDCASRAPATRKGREWKDTEGNGTERQETEGHTICPETEEPSAGPVADPLVTFPVDGGNRVWAFTDEHLAELRDSFPSLDVMAEVRKARGWIQADSSRRKTARGMSRFLFSWMDRAQNSHKSSKSRDPRGNLAAAEDFLSQGRETF